MSNEQNILKRSISYDLEQWLCSPIRSPLLLFGPRQVGKTTLLSTFAAKIGRKVIEVNFWRDKKGQLKRIFSASSDAFDILKELEDYYSIEGINLDEDVLILDEIQECPETYSSLKSFKEQVPQLKVLATGSYLQLFVASNRIKHHPVGCVDTFYLKPLSLNFLLILYTTFQPLEK